MAGTKTFTEGLLALVCESAEISGSSVQNSVEGIDVTSIQDGSTCYVRDTQESYRFVETSLAAPAPLTVILPYGQPLGTPGRWILIASGGGGGVPLATIQNILVAGPTPVTNTQNTQARVNFAGAATVVLPAAAVGKQATVKDVSGNASVNNITVQTSSGTIDGAANYYIATNWGSATFLCVSTSPVIWDVI